MRHADYCGFFHRGMPHQRIFEIDGADPLAARLHQVFRTVDDLDVALFVHVGDVTGAKPTVGSPAGCLVWAVVITRGDPGTTNFEFAGSLSVTWSFDFGHAVFIFRIFGTHDAKFD